MPAVGARLGIGGRVQQHTDRHLLEDFRRDGDKLGFTDHVRDLEVGRRRDLQGGSGYTRTAIPDTADLAGR